MFLKTDWTQHIHWIRRNEVEKVFSFLGSKKFKSGIEFGAGDGHQTIFLAPHFVTFISSDLNFGRIKENQKLSDVQYVKCDADNLEGIFEDKQFDLIFSSNMLEHLSNPKSFLKNVHMILKDGGYNVHVVPNRFVKITFTLFFYANVLTLILDRIIGLFQGKKIFRGAEIYLENNINVISKNKEGRFRKIFIPSIHGNFKSHTEEFTKFGKKSWENLFMECEFEVVKYIKGPAFSGYGFGFDKLRGIFEYLGWSSEHIFILKKKN